MGGHDWIFLQQQGLSIVSRMVLRSTADTCAWLVCTEQPSADARLLPVLVTIVMTVMWWLQYKLQSRHNLETVRGKNLITKSKLSILRKVFWCTACHAVQQPFPGQSAWSWHPRLDSRRVQLNNSVECIKCNFLIFFFFSFS